MTTGLKKVLQLTEKPPSSTKQRSDTGSKMTNGKAIPRRAGREGTISQQSNGKANERDGKQRGNATSILHFFKKE